MLGVMASLLQTLRVCETRLGVQLPDPLLPLLPIADLSVPIFIIEYGSIVAVCYRLTHQPVRLTVAFLAYGITMAFRMCSILLVPLEPPQDLVILVDPFTSMLTNGPIITKDLFFSGHTATMSILAYAAPRGKLKYLLCGLTVVIALMVLIQRNHYTVDVVVAPVMAYVGWRIARNIRHRVLGSPVETH